MYIIQNEKVNRCAVYTDSICMYNLSSRNSGYRAVSMAEEIEKKSNFAN